MSQSPVDKGPVNLVEALGRFFFASLFGCLMSLCLAACTLWFGFAFVWQPPWIHLLWIVPVVWGVLGIFWFDEMLRLAADLFEDAVGYRE